MSKVALSIPQRFSCIRRTTLYRVDVSLVWFGLLSLLVIERRARCPPLSDD